MNPGERLEAIRRIASNLGERSYPDIDLVLSTFDLPAFDNGNWLSGYEYVIDKAARGTDEALAELDAYLSGDGSGLPQDEDRIWESGSFRLFISHTSTHKVRAASIAETAHRLGIHGFVAHDTIEPTSEWQAAIETALRTCHALVAMVTKDFVQSRWCDQEVGYVLAQRKPVLALKMGADPHGFMGRFQGIPSSVERDVSYADVHAMVRALVQHPSVHAQTAPLAVRRYARSGSFDSARDGYELLKSINPQDWTPAMIEEVDRANTSNNQLAHANLIGGEPMVHAVAALLEPLRPKPVPATAPDDDDIPF